MKSNFVPFGEKALRTMVTLYQSLATDIIVMQKQVLHRIVQVSGDYAAISVYFAGSCKQGCVLIA